MAPCPPNVKCSKVRKLLDNTIGSQTTESPYLPSHQIFVLSTCHILIPFVLGNTTGLCSHARIGETEYTKPLLTTRKEAPRFAMQTFQL